MAGTGGPRPGAGRKQKIDKYKVDINKAEKQIRDKLPEIVQSQIALALGVKTVDALTGLVYTTIPDRAAGQYLMNRIMGSPMQKQEISGSIETIRVVYEDPIVSDGE